MDEEVYRKLVPVKVLSAIHKSPVFETAVNETADDRYPGFTGSC
jgi:hypothetical protein